MAKILCTWNTIKKRMPWFWQSRPKTFDNIIQRLEWYQGLALSLSTTDKIEKNLRRKGIKVLPLTIDIDNYREWANKYSSLVPWQPDLLLPEDIASIQNILRSEKLLEYYLTAQIHPFIPGSNVGDFGCGASRFLEWAVSEYGINGWAVDPALASLPLITKPGIKQLPLSVSESLEILPIFDMITHNCSFEMF